MKSDKRRAKLAALLAEDEEDELLKIEINPQQEQINQRNQASRDAEAVLGFVLRPNRFIKRLCNNCQASFYTDYSCVAYCSDSCRRHALESIGIKWDLTKPLETRWGNPAPLVVPPNVLDLLKKSLDLTQSTESQLPEPLQELPQIGDQIFHQSENGNYPVLSDVPELPDLDLEFSL